MAEVTALRNNALPYPVYGVPYGIIFPLLDEDGDLVTGSGSDTPDSEVSLNGDTFADCTNELTEIATASGMYYLLLTAAEMTADVVSVICKVATATTQTTPLVLYPRKLSQIRTGTAQAGAVGTITLDATAIAVNDSYNGCLIYLDGGTGSGQARIITAYGGSTKIAAVTPNWATTPDATSTFVVYQPEGRWVVEANVKALDDDAAAANNLELDYDGTGYAKANSTIGTCTTNTDMRGTDNALLAASSILNVQPLIPISIDLADTATVRLGLALTNMLDDLPSAAEITPGTITIDRKAAGGTAWTTIVNAAACSEAAGLVYYDEVFDDGTGYAEGDSIRATFKSQKITVAANDYEITDTGGWAFHTYIRQAVIIAAIKAKTDTLGTTDITVTSPVSSDGTVAFTPFDDLYNAESRSLEWTNSDGDWGGGSLTGAAIGLKVTHQVTGIGSTFDGTVVTSSGTQKVRVELSSTQTGALVHGRLYDYHLRAIMAGTTHIETLKIGTITPTIALFGAAT